jgi:NADPH-dependent 2,4-dienoyl-CoA reductase/sulfur reductase-like enzyme
VTLHLGRTVRHLDPQAKRVTDDQGAIYGYDKLLLATGGTPRRLPFGGEQIIYYRSVDDYERLRSLTQEGQRFAVIGGGFIGSETAAALAITGKKVVMIFPDAGVGARMFPLDLAQFLNDFYRQKGVEVLPGQRVDGLETRGGRALLKVSNKQGQAERDMTADGVVAGIGIQPNVELAQAAGLEVDDGVRVDRSLRTSRPDIYAAGDVANFFNPALDRRLRVEHEDNANTMGRLAGQSMAGRAVAYDHLPFFYSDLFELGYEAVGEVDSRLETVADWKQPYREGVVYYLREGPGAGRAAVKRLGAGGLCPQTDRRAGAVPPREPQRALAGLTVANREARTCAWCRRGKRRLEQCHTTSGQGIMLSGTRRRAASGGRSRKRSPPLSSSRDTRSAPRRRSRST